MDSAVFYRSARMQYPLAVAGAGAVITDAAGNDYLDMSGGAAVSCLGHGHPDVIAATCRQLQALAFAHTAFFTNEPQEALAFRLAERFPEPGARVYFCSGGSEANETALKLAWQYHAACGQPERKTIVSREHSYHGNTLGALSVSGNAARRRASGAPLMDWPRIPPCYPYREQLPDETIADYGERAAQTLDLAITTSGADKVAAFIAEPVAGSSLGVVPAAPGYFRQVREICDRHGLLLIADEIMCGGGRTGHYFAHEHDNIVPDIVTLAKGVGGGVQPLAAVVVREKVVIALEESGFAHGHTYVGHAAACAAGLAVQEVIDRDSLLAKTQLLGEELLNLLDDAFREHPNVGNIRTRGLFAGIELVSDRVSRAGFDNGVGLDTALKLAALERGLICYPGGIAVDGRFVPHIMLAPPMIVSREQMREGVRRLALAVDAVLAQRP